MIPNRLIRTVPTKTSKEVEGFWAHACDLHPDWDHTTFRDPIDPNLFPLTSKSWHRCTSGAQLAGLIRLEALYRWGGFYLDSDIEVFRCFDPLRVYRMVAAWEDEQTVPDAFIAAEAKHPALLACITLAIRRLHDVNNPDWRTGSGAWSTGPGVFTTVLPDRDDVTLFGPSLVFPVHYTEKDQLDEFDWEAHPETYAMHRWHGSWLA